MPESIQHHKLVRFLTSQVKEIVPTECWSLIQIDSPESLNLTPQTQEGYRPDVYYRFNGLLIIGEAKTAKDVEMQHSRVQYESYLKECSVFEGQAYFLLAVPLLEKATANNILQRMKKQILGDYQIIVKGWIDGLI